MSVLEGKCVVGGSVVYFSAMLRALLFIIDRRGGLVFFFFQAEDGIRDATVTGVQTCALPISGPRVSRWNGPWASWPNGLRSARSSPAPSRSTRRIRRFVGSSRATVASRSWWRRRPDHSREPGPADRSRPPAHGGGTV